MSKKITVKTPNTGTDEYVLGEGITDVGRRQDCAITLDDSAASGRHANFIVVLDDAFIEDCGSSNGTYINIEQNQDKISRVQRLKHNDAITIGTNVLTYSDEIDANIDAGFSKDAVYFPTSPATAAAIAKIAEQSVDITDTVLGVPANGWGNAAIGSLTIAGKVGNGNNLNLARNLVALGRPGKQLAAISRWPQGYFISHIGSDGDGKRYPLLNSEPVPSSVRLCNNDKINLVGLELVFNI
ncbi:MAG: FHA domain-containing protein [Candidatus Porifericomitaceae bacterium WSBS_2022_MAG_OTU9]